MMKPRIPRRRSLGPVEQDFPEEHWVGERQLPEDLPRALRTGLLEPGLLTDWIAQESGQRPKLQLLSLHWAELTGAQRSHLRVAGSRCFVREIELVCRNKRWVFAQSRVPECQRALKSWLASLGPRPMGEALSAMQGVTYGALEYCCLPSSHPLVQRAQRGRSPLAAGLWTRQRLIALAGQRVLLQEILLPDAFGT